MNNRYLRHTQQVRSALGVKKGDIVKDNRQNNRFDRIKYTTINGNNIMDLVSDYLIRGIDTMVDNEQYDTMAVNKLNLTNVICAEILNKQQMIKVGLSNQIKTYQTSLPTTYLSDQHDWYHFIYGIQLVARQFSLAMNAAKDLLVIDPQSTLVDEFLTDFINYYHKNSVPGFTIDNTSEQATLYEQSQQAKKDLELEYIVPPIPYDYQIGQRYFIMSTALLILIKHHLFLKQDISDSRVKQQIQNIDNGLTINAIIQDLNQSLTCANDVVLKNILDKLRQNHPSTKYREYVRGKISKIKQDMQNNKMRKNNIVEQDTEKVSINQAFFIFTFLSAICISSLLIYVFVFKNKNQSRFIRNKQIK